MLVKAIKQYQSLFRSITALLVCWTLSVYIFLQYSPCCQMLWSEDDFLSPTIKQPLENTLQGFSLFSYDPQNDYRLSYSIQIDKLKMTNGKLGLFRSALCKQVNLQDLSLNFYTDCQDSNPKTSGSSKFYETLEQLSESLPGHFQETIDDDRRQNTLVSDFLENVAVNVSHFRLHWLDEDRVQLDIQSRQAILTAQAPNQLILRGAVILRSPQAIIRSNHVIWDIDQQTFTVQGHYMVKRHNNRQFGCDDCFDSQLNIQTKGSIAQQEQGETQCIAKK